MVSKNIDQHSNKQVEPVKKTAVFASGEQIWLLIEDVEENPNAFMFNGTWWIKVTPH